MSSYGSLRTFDNYDSERGKEEVSSTPVTPKRNTIRYAKISIFVICVLIVAVLTLGMKDTVDMTANNLSEELPSTISTQEESLGLGFIPSSVDTVDRAATVTATAIDDDATAKRTLNPTPSTVRTASPTPSVKKTLHPTAATETTTRAAAVHDYIAATRTLQPTPAKKKTRHPSALTVTTTTVITTPDIISTDTSTTATSSSSSSSSSSTGVPDTQMRGETAEGIVDEEGRRTLNPTPVHFPATLNPTPAGFDHHPTDKPTESPVESYATGFIKKSSRIVSKSSTDDYAGATRTLNPTPAVVKKTRYPTYPPAANTFATGLDATATTATDTSSS